MSDMDAMFSDDPFAEASTVGSSDDHKSPVIDEIEATASDAENETSSDEESEEEEENPFAKNPLQFLRKIGLSPDLEYQLTITDKDAVAPLSIKPLLSVSFKNMTATQRAHFEDYVAASLSTMPSMVSTTLAKVTELMQKLPYHADAHVALAKEFSLAPIGLSHGVFQDNFLYAIESLVNPPAKAEESVQEAQYYPCFVVDPSPMPILTQLLDSDTTDSSHSSSNRYAPQTSSTFADITDIPVPPPKYPTPTNQLPLPWLPASSGGFAGMVNCCFNCGASHNARDCREPRNEAIIRRNLQINRSYSVARQQEDMWERGDIVDSALAIHIDGTPSKQAGRGGTEGRGTGRDDKRDDRRDDRAYGRDGHRDTRDGRQGREANSNYDGRGSDRGAERGEGRAGDRGGDRFSGLDFGSPAALGRGGRGGDVGGRDRERDVSRGAGVRAHTADGGRDHGRERERDRDYRHEGGYGGHNGGYNTGTGTGTGMGGGDGRGYGYGQERGYGREGGYGGDGAGGGGARSGGLSYSHLTPHSHVPSHLQPHPPRTHTHPQSHPHQHSQAPPGGFRAPPPPLPAHLAGRPMSAPKGRSDFQPPPPPPFGRQR